VWIKALIFVFAIECFCLQDLAVHRLDAEFRSSGSGNLKRHRLATAPPHQEHHGDSLGSLLKPIFLKFVIPDGREANARRHQHASRPEGPFVSSHDLRYSLNRYSDLERSDTNNDKRRHEWRRSCTKFSSVIDLSPSGLLPASQ
jgi:hypothetical protein